MSNGKLPLLEKVRPFLKKIIRFFQFRRKKKISLEIERIISDFQISHDQLLQENERLKAEEIKAHELSVLLEAQIEEMNRVKALESQARNQIIELNKKNEMLSKVKCEMEQKWGFIKTILSTEIKKNSAMEYFSNLMQNDFMEFANNESSLAAEAEAVITMQSVEKELEMITGFPDIFGKCIIALAGGFSCGKSSFINSFFSNDMIKLPVGINPVTAIPTYVIAGKKPRIRGYSNCGGSFEILPEMFQQLSYDIENEFQYSIRKIVPYLALSAELNGLDNICFIDTPGYNSQGEGEKKSDWSSTVEAILQADSLLWFVSVDSGGTLSMSDIEFIEGIDIQNKNIYIVINKVDLRPEREINSIMDQVGESLVSFGINYRGISAYSTARKKEYVYANLSLQDFLKEQCECKCMTQKKIINKIDSVLDNYQEAITNNIGILKERKKIIHSIKLDLIELAVETTETNLDYRLADLQKSCDYSLLEQQLLALKK